jgi:hypothetical protein
LQSVNKNLDQAVSLLMAAIKRNAGVILLEPIDTAIDLSKQCVHIGKVDSTLVLTLKDVPQTNGPEDSKPVAQ